MALDKKKLFEEIDEKLNEVRILCNRAMIPFFWVAAIGDSEDGTEYAMRADAANKENIRKNYTMNGISPMSLGVDLKDDRIRELFKIMNGYRAVPQDAPYRDAPDIDMDDVISGAAAGAYLKEAADSKEGAGLYLDIDPETDSLDADEEILDPEDGGYPEGDAVEVISSNSTSFPRIDSDFEE